MGRHVRAEHDGALVAIAEVNQGPVGGRAEPSVCTWAPGSMASCTNGMTQAALRIYGNAINEEAAKAVIAAYMETTP